MKLRLTKLDLVGLRPAARRIAARGPVVRLPGVARWVLCPVAPARCGAFLTASTLARWWLAWPVGLTGPMLVRGRVVTTR